MTRCSFCGNEFSEEEGAKACRACAAFGGCRAVKCPRCGFEMPQTPPLTKLIAEWRRKRMGQPGCEAGVPLTKMKPGCRAVVLAMEGATAHDRNKLMALGLLPGSTVSLLQRFPSYVVAVGYTQVALDRETARLVQVRPEG